MTITTILEEFKDVIDREDMKAIAKYGTQVRIEPKFYLDFTRQAITALLEDIEKDVNEARGRGPTLEKIISKYKK